MSASFFGFRRSTVPVSRVIALTLSGRGWTLWSAFERLDVEAFAVASQAMSIALSAGDVLGAAGAVMFVPWVWFASAGAVVLVPRAWLASAGAVVFVVCVSVELPG